MEHKTHNKIVYKYRTWANEYHKKMLIENELFFASPKSFKDPFDCKIPANFSLLDTYEKVDSYARTTITNLEPYITENGLNKEFEIEKLRNRVINESAKLQKQYEQIFFKGVDNCYGVVSLSERWNSTLMWSHYANNHEGFCVGFDLDKLKELDEVSLGNVIYPDNNFFPDISLLNNNPFEELMLEVYHKSNEWSYEEEFRLSTLYPSGLTNDKRKRKVKDDYFAEIIIGLNTPESHFSEILAIVKEKKIKVYKIRKVPFKFELERVEIII